MQDSDLHQQPNMQGPLGPIVPAYDLQGNAIRAVIPAFAALPISVAAAGINIATAATQVTAALPNNSAGNTPSSVRLAVTQDTYIRLSAASVTSAVPAAAGSGYLVGDTITLTGGTFTTAMVLAVATAKLISTSANALGSGYTVADTITLAGGTASTKAVLTLVTTRLASVAINAAGTGYAIGNTVTLAGGTSSIKPVITVATVGGSGEILTFTITTRGSFTVQATSFTQDSSSGAGTGATFQTGLFAPLTWTVSNAGDYTLTATSLTQFASSGAGTGATFNSALFGVKTVTVSNPGDYSVDPTSPVSQGSTSGSGTSATFTVTFATAAVAGDTLVTRESPLILSTVGFEHISAIRVSADGLLQISPIG